MNSEEWIVAVDAVQFRVPGQQSSDESCLAGSGTSTSGTDDTSLPGDEQRGWCTVRLSVISSSSLSEVSLSWLTMSCILSAVDATAGRTGRPAEQSPQHKLRI